MNTKLWKIILKIDGWMNARYVVTQGMIFAALLVMVLQVIALTLAAGLYVGCALGR